MRRIQIESWAIQIIERVESNGPLEDSRVELKAKWIDIQKAARRLAGHANAARGEPILWLIGIDQDNGVIGAEQEELANWYAAVQSEFDGISPSLTDLNLTYNDTTVVLLYFETDRAPYVVKNPRLDIEKGSISHEVPWREGTRTRSAKRSDLIKLLVPVVSLPELEILSGKFYISLQNEKWHCYLSITSYIIPNPGQACIIPFHKCDASFTVEDILDEEIFSDIKIIPPHKRVPGNTGIGLQGSRYGYFTEPDSMTISNTKNEAIIQGPGQMDIICEHWIQPQDIDLKNSKVRINVNLKPTHTNGNIHFAETLIWSRINDNNIGNWILREAT